ncbi:hypothetical protein Tco_1277319 [Tanacetum coccineum]
MSQDQSIPRRNKVDWHMANDDPILTTIRFIPQHEVVQKYGAILSDNLTNQAIKESEAYKTYYDFSTRKAIAKPKYKKQLAEGLETLSEIALSEAEHMKLAIEKSKTQLHSSQPSSSPNVPTYGSNDEQISWKSSDEEDDDDEANISKDDDDVADEEDDDSDDDEQTELDNDGDDFVHLKLTTHDDEERSDEEEKEEDSFDPRVYTPSYVKTTDDEANNEETFGGNVEEEINEEVPVQEFEDRVKALENDLSEFKQTNQFATSLSSIPDIVDKYLASKHKDVVDVAIQLKSNKLQDEAQAKNQDFINKIDDNIKKIIKEQVKIQVKEQVNKIFPRIEKSVPQKNLYKALVEAYEADKDILETYGDIVTFKRRQDDHDADEEPSAGLNRGSKRRRDGKEPESTSAPKEKSSKITSKSKDGSKSHHSNLAREEDPRESFDELIDTSLDFSTFMMNRLKVDTLTPELLAGLTFELMKGSCKSLVELEYFFKEVYKATTEKLDWNNPEGQESARDVYFRRRIIAVTKLQIVKWHGYKHLDWITVCRDDDKLYTFKKGDYKRLHLQDIEDMLILFIQGKLTNLNVEERLAFSVSLRMFTRSIVIQKRVEDLQLGVENYQKKLNIIKPNTYRSDLKRRETYTAYSNPRGFIYQNKEKKNKLICIDELHKFSDSTLNDVRTTLDDRLTEIRMEYLPQTIWRNSDTERAAAMIQAIDKHLNRE